MPKRHRVNRLKLWLTWSAFAWAFIRPHCAFAGPTGFSYSEDEIRRLALVLRQYFDGPARDRMTEWAREMNYSPKALSEFLSEGRSYFEKNLFLANGSIQSEFLKSLNIELPIAEIERIYRQFGAIQLRPLAGGALLVGCGNRPTQVGNRPDLHAGSSWTKGEGGGAASFLAYQEKHAHIGWNTVDPDIRMNPTVVGFFGEDGTTRLLRTHPGGFEKVESESVGFFPKMEKAKELLLSAFWKSSGPDCYRSFESLPKNKVLR